MSTGGPGHEHRFDPVSGWCAWCNLRDDGRLVGKGGQVFHEGADDKHDTAEKKETTK